MVVDFSVFSVYFEFSHESCACLEVLAKRLDCPQPSTIIDPTIQERRCWCSPRRCTVVLLWFFSSKVRSGARATLKQTTLLQLLELKGQTRWILGGDWNYWPSTQPCQGGSAVTVRSLAVRGAPFIYILRLLPWMA